MPPPWNLNFFLIVTADVKSFSIKLCVFCSLYDGGRLCDADTASDSDESVRRLSSEDQHQCDAHQPVTALGYHAGTPLHRPSCFNLHNRYLKFYDC
jgi:hypothetical protein